MRVHVIRKSLVLCALFSLLWIGQAQAKLFQGDGKDHIIYVNGALTLFARDNGVSFTVTRLNAAKTVLWKGTIAQKGQMVSKNFKADHVRIESTKPINVVTGKIGKNNSHRDAYATYLISDQGLRVGKRFDGFTRQELYVFCYKGGSSTASRVVVTDITDRNKANDDTVTLTSTSATYTDKNIDIWYTNRFDDDQIRIESNRDCSAMVGYRTRNQADWSVTPPSVLPEDKGRTFGKRFYYFVHRTLLLFPLEDNTNITIRDLTDKDDNHTVKLNRNEFFTVRPFPAVYNKYKQIQPSKRNEFENDFVEIISDKPIMTYSGPNTSDIKEHSTYPVAIPKGGGKHEYFCFIQNGAAKDFQILAETPQTAVTVTTMAGNRNDRSIIHKIGPGGLAWKGVPNGPSYWESDKFKVELVHITSNRQLVVLCGDFDKESWQSFISAEIPNRPPNIQVTGTTRINEGQKLTFSIGASDPDKDALTWSITGAPTGATITGTGNARTFTWTPNYAQAGTYRLTVKVTDNGHPQQSKTQVITITVVDVNRHPIFTTNPPTTATEKSVYTYTPKTIELDKQKVTYKLLSGPPGAKIDANTGKITWTPGSDDVKAGKRKFTIQACDNGTPQKCAVQNWTVTVKNVNDPPKITSTPPKTATQGKVYTYTPKATDPDPNETLTWKKVSGPANAKVDPKTGQVTWTPNAGDAAAGSRTIVIEVCDKSGSCTRQTIPVKVNNVNDPPVLTNKAATQATAGKSYTFTPSVSDPDPADKGKHTFTLTKKPAGATIDSKTGKISWTPSTSDAGKSFTFELQICDPAKACIKVTWTVKVTNTPNSPPKVTNQPTGKADPGKLYTYTPNVSDDPADKGKHTFKLNKGAPGAKIDPKTGKLDWTPDPGDAGKSFNFEIEICDPRGACVKVQWTITVSKNTGNNKPPVISGTPPGVAYKGETLTYTPKVSDPDTKDTHSWRLKKGPSTAKVNPKTGAFSWTPGASDVGKTIEFEIEVCDNGTPKACVIQSFKIQVKQKCQVDIDCSGKEICNKQGIIYICTSPGCAANKPKCPAGQFCLEGKCKRDACPLMNCGPGTVCRPSDNKCVKVCTNVKCKTGERCVDGNCVISKCKTPCKTGEYCDEADPKNPKCTKNTCGAGSCKHGRVCQQGRCIDDPCTRMGCPTPGICKAGQCVSGGGCFVDVDCPGDQVCIQGKCAAPNCYTTAKCTSAQLCRDTKCQANNCAGSSPKQCAKGEFCRPYDNTCVKSCSGVTCPAGEFCQSGKCQKDPCSGVNCPVGQTCVNGKCEKKHCGSGKSCRHKRVCNNKTNQCEDDLCIGVTCPSGQTCQQGQCSGTSKCRFDADCPGTELCINNTCIKPKCSKNSDCSSGQLCVSGTCVVDACKGKTCPAGEFCKAGQCIKSCAGVFCSKGSFCKEGKCTKDPCAGAQCKAGELCVNGRCIKDDCKANSCKGGRVCKADHCTEDPCQGIQCPGGQQCQNGQCTGSLSCKVDTDCPAPGVCVKGTCQVAGCYLATCASGKLCLNGTCTDDPCKGKQCAAGETCRSTDGQCVKDCPKCPNGQRCQNGTCSADPCAQTQCQADESCVNGTCVKDACKASTPKCRYKRSCKNSACQDDPCLGIKCPANHTCQEGACHRDTTGESHQENPTEQSEPAENAQEQQPDELPGDADAGDIAHADTQEHTTEGALDNNSGSEQGDGGTGDQEVEKSTGNDSSAGENNATGDKPPLLVGGGCGCQSTQRPPVAWLFGIFLLFGLMRKRVSSS